MSNFSSQKKTINTAQNSNKKSYQSKYIGIINQKKNSKVRASLGNNEKLNDDLCSQDQISLSKQQRGVSSSNMGTMKNSPVKDDKLSSKRRAESPVMELAQSTVVTPQLPKDSTLGKQFDSIHEVSDFN